MLATFFMVFPRDAPFHGPALLHGPGCHFAMPWRCVPRTILPRFDEAAMDAAKRQ
jgi:hypothetical protein